MDNLKEQMQERAQWLGNHDDELISKNNKEWREKICSEETTFRIAAIILKYSKQLECGKCVIPLEEDCYGGDTEVQIAKEITGLLSEMGKEGE